MKKQSKHILTLLVFLIFFMTISGHSQNEVVVSFDERIELLTCIGILTPHGSSQQAQFVHPIRRSALEYFESYKNHKAVQIADEILDHIFLDRFPGLALSFRSISDLTVSKFPQNIGLEIGNSKILEDFAKAVKDFYQDTHFEKFWEEHVNEYARVAERFNQEIAQISVRKPLEDYFGQSKPEFRFNIYVSFLTPAGFLFGSPELEEHKVRYSVISPTPVPPDSASYDQTSGKDLIGGAIHEFGHSFVNPVTAKFQSEVAKREWLFKTLNQDDVMTKLYYPTWGSCLNENIVRAATTRIYKYVTRQTPKDKWEGGHTPFLLIPFIYEKLGDYEKNRSKFPTYESFFPEILSLLDQLEPFEEIVLDFSFDLYEKEGKFYVNWISYGSSAQNAGLLVNDRVIKVGKETIKSIPEFNKIRQDIMNGKWGKKVDVTIERNGRIKGIPIVLNESKVSKLRIKNV